MERHCVGVVLAASLFAATFSTLSVAADQEPSRAASAAQHNTRALQQFRAGHFEQALAAWDRALALYTREDKPVARAAVQQHRGDAYFALGRYRKAAAAYEAALALAKGIDDAALIAEATVGLGTVLAYTGQRRRAEALLDAGRARAHAADRAHIAAKAGHNLANLYADRGELDQAITNYRQALDIAQAIEDRRLGAKAGANLARALVDNDQPDAARKELARAADHARSLPPSHEQAYVLISLGRLYERLPGENDAAAANRMQAYQLYRAARNTAASIDDPRARAYALGYMGGLYESAGRTEEALRLTRRAVHHAQKIDAPEILYRWHWQTGRLLQARGNVGGAIAAYQRAVYTLEGIRHEFTPTAGHGDFRARFGPLYLQLADLLLQRAEGRAATAPAEEDLVQVRNIMEQFKSAELEDYFQDDCVAALKVRTQGIDTLNERTAAIYPIIFPDRVELLLSLPTGMKSYSTAVDRETFESAVRTLRRYLEKRTTHQYLPHAQRLYDWLIRPLESDLRAQDVDTLVMIPDGVLRTIPLAALHDGDGFLINNYVVATTPGLTLTDPEPIQRQQARVMINGLTESVQGFPALPEVEQELTTIEKLFPGTVLKNEDFRLAQVEQALAEQPYSIVHIASHGRFRGEIEDTFLLTYDGKMTMDRLETYMARTAYRENPVELLTLSACQTAAGDERAALGLAGIAVKAGARSALATLWYISDEASSILVSEFYRQLKDPALTKAQALQRAQLKLLGDGRYRHPSYWAPFLLIGNWL